MIRSPTYYVLVAAAFIGALAAVVIATATRTHPAPHCRTLAEVRASSSAWPRWTIINGRRCWYTGHKAEARRRARMPQDANQAVLPAEPRREPADAPPAPPLPPLPPDPLRPSTAFAGALLPVPVTVLDVKADLPGQAEPPEPPPSSSPPHVLEPRAMWPVFLLATTAGAALIFTLINMVIPAPASRRRPAKRAKPEPWPPTDLDFELPAWCLREAERYRTGR
jgi:hypothetical protein